MNVSTEVKLFPTFLGKNIFSTASSLQFFLWLLFEVMPGFKPKGGLRSAAADKVVMASGIFWNWDYKHLLEMQTQVMQQLSCLTLLKPQETLLHQTLKFNGYTKYSQ